MSDAGLWLENFPRDVQYGLRVLGRRPGFTAVTALLVALGIGSTTAIFSVVYGVMLRPLPYPEPDRLVALWTRLPNSSERARLNPADYREFRTNSTVFEDIALANAPQNFNLIGLGEPERLTAARLSSNVLSVLRVTPALGRGFTPEDYSGNDRVVLLSDGLWRRRFGADPSIVGRTINLSGISYEVIGVMPADFSFPEREHQLWIPLTIDPRLLTRQIAGYSHFAIARLKTGIPIAQAQREIDALAARLEAAFPATNRGTRIEVLPLIEESIRMIRPVLYMLLAAVLSLLLIACLNLASLLGTRAASRAGEFSVRLAIGASRGRLMLQALAEVVPVIAAGGVLGVAAAKFAIDAFVPIAPAALPRVDRIEINGSVLVFSIAVLALTGFVAGLLPAAQAWRANVPSTTTGGRSATSSRGHATLQSAIVAVQLALTLPLLFGAVALSRSFSALMKVDPGFQTENVLSLHMAIPRSKYRSDEEIAAFYRRILQQVTAIPGVISAGMVNRLPLTGIDFVLPVEFEEAPGRPVPLQSRSVTPDYFRTMGIPIHEGRVFEERDSAKAPLVSLVDERLARTRWPGQSAIGKRFRVALPGQQPTSGEIVGVVGNIRHRGLDTAEDRQIYFSYQQFTDGRIALVVRGNADVRPLRPAVAQAIRSIDPDQPVYDVKSMDDVVARSTSERWLNTTIIAIFALSSLLLAGVGLYGVIAYGVAQRIREFGLRMALGADRALILRLVIRSVVGLLARGLAIGLALVIVTMKLLQGMLFAVGPHDTLTIATALGLLSAVALFAAYLPARRATRVNPAIALRSE